MRLPSAVRTAVALILGLAFAAPSSAEPCLRGRELPECRSFLITEIAYARRLGGDELHYGFGEFGYMRNRSEHSALGGTAMFGVRGNGASELRGGAAVRVRRWVASSNAVDLSGGPFLASADGLTRLGGAAEVIYNFKDRFHLASRWEYVKMPQMDESSWYLGFGLGSKPALIVGGIAGVVMGAAAASWE